MFKKIFFIIIIVSFAFTCIFTLFNKTILAEEKSSEGIKEEEAISQKVDINTASQEDLEKIKGIGPGLAKKIIEYRESHGSFEKIEDIINVKGIGEKKFEKIKEFITVTEKE